MHPRQASLLSQATELSDKLAAKKQSQPKEPPGQAILWQYVDPSSGKKFWLDEKKTTGVKSPFTGKAISVKPTRHTPGQIGKELKEGEPAEKTASSF